MEFPLCFNLTLFLWDRFQVSPCRDTMKISCHLRMRPNDESIKLQFTARAREWALKQESHHFNVCIQSDKAKRKTWKIGSVALFMMDWEQFRMIVERSLHSNIGKKKEYLWITINSMRCFSYSFWLHFNITLFVKQRPSCFQLTKLHWHRYMLQAHKLLDFPNFLHNMS